MQLESFTLSGATHLSGHSHPTLHLCLVESGGFEELNGKGRLACGPGTIRVSAAGTQHTIQVQSSGATGRVAELNSYAQRSLSTELRGSVLLDAETHHITVQRLFHGWDSGDRFGTECASLELAAAAVNPWAASPPTWLAELRAELESGSQSAHSLSALAARHRRHRSHVARSFRAHFGRTIGEHLQAHRAYLAAQRLRETDQPLAALAMDLGFADQSHLTRIFGRHFGMSPSQYRRHAAACGQTQLSFKTL